MPVTSPKRPVEIRVELVAGDGDGERPLFRSRWSVPGPVSKGEGLVLEYRYDANQVLELRLRLATRAGTDAWACAVENPLTNVVNPQAARLKLDTLEEAIRTGVVAKDEVAEALVEAADLMAELGHRERAFAQLKKVLASRNAPDGGILNRMGSLAAEIGDAERAVKLYREAAAAEPSLGRAAVQPGAAARAARRPCRGARGDRRGARAREPTAVPCPAGAPRRHAGARGGARARPRRRHGGLRAGRRGSSEWALGWLITAATMAGDAALQEKARAELKLRRRGPAARTSAASCPACATWRSCAHENVARPAR